MEPQNRYAAKLLFQFRVAVGGRDGVRRTCEERILNFDAADARSALVEAKRRGRAAQHHYDNSDGNRVHFQFVGILELLHLGSECDEGEVWYEISERVRPMERRKAIIPPTSRLSAIRNRE